MRIVHLDTGRELRGGQRQLLLLAQGLADRGHQQVILARKGSALWRECARLGLDARPLRNLGGEAAQADVVHSHDARAHSLAVLAASDKPLVVSRRVAFPPGAGMLSRWKYQRASRYLAVSEYVKAQMTAAGVAAEKISVVYDGVRLPSPDSAAPRERLVVAPATEDPRKGSALATEACRAAAVQLQFSRDLDKDLPRAALFLYLSHSEGLGSAILLAMANRTPVVASRVGGIPEIVEHQRTGLLVDNDAGAIGAAIRLSLDDPATAGERAEAAYRQVHERFTDAIMVAETESSDRLALQS